MSDPDSEIYVYTSIFCMLTITTHRRSLWCLSHKTHLKHRLVSCAHVTRSGEDVPEKVLRFGAMLAP